MSERPIEHDRRARLVGVRVRLPGGKVDDALARLPDAGRRHGPGRGGTPSNSDHRSGMTNEAVRVLSATLAKELPKRRRIGRIDGCVSPQLHVRPLVAGQHRELEPVPGGRAVECFQGMSRVALAAERPDHDKLGVPRRAIDPGVHAERMGQPQQARQPHGWSIVRHAVLSVGKSGKLGICCR